MDMNNKTEFPNGVWPVMLTTFDADGNVDYTGLERLIKWYENEGVAGIFAVCQSSEMFQLSLDERINIATFVKKKANVPVIASGHVSYSIEEQLKELNAIAKTGVDAIIFISSLLAKEDEDDKLLLERLKKLTESLEYDVPLGIYECPYPYKRVLSDEIISWCVASEKFYFIKDTCCDIERIKRRLDIMKNSRMKLFNANTATLLESVRYGASGYSGVMANFHPALYEWMLRHYQDQKNTVEELSAVLTMCSYIEMKNYPQNAKYALQEMGLSIDLMTRKINSNGMSPTLEGEVRQLNYLSGIWKKRLKLI